MKRFFVLLLAALLIFSAVPVLAEEPVVIPVEIKTTQKEIKLPRGFRFRPVIVDKKGNEVEVTGWKTSKEEVIPVFSDTNMYAFSVGSATIKGKSANKTYSIKVTIPKVYTTHDKITIETPDPVVFGYQLNAGGISSVGTKGSAAKISSYEFVADENTDPIVAAVADRMTFYEIIPVKAGTFKIVFNVNGRNAKTVTITVKKTAIEE